MKLPEGYTYWDPTERLKDMEYARLYVEACADEDLGDGNVIRASLQDVARAQNTSALARKIGISREGLYKALSPNGNPSFATIMRITRALEPEEERFRFAEHLVTRLTPPLAQGEPTSTVTAAATTT